MFQKGDLCKHFKGENLVEKNIYEILEVGVKYTGECEQLEEPLIVYRNIFQEGKVFAREEKDLIAELAIEKQEKFNLDEIENHIRKVLNDKCMSDNEYIKKIHSDILIQSYVINLSRFKAVANTAYSICFNRKYLSDFVNSIIDKSILQHYINEKENKTSSGNMFKKGEKTTLSAKNINKIINHFGEKWK